MLSEIKGKRVLMKHNEQNCQVQGSQNPSKQYKHSLSDVMNDTTKYRTYIALSVICDNGNETDLDLLQ